MKHIVMFSGGVGSWAAAKRVQQVDGDELILLFADTLMEDEDLYRFLKDAAADVGGTLIKLKEGRDPWQVFKDVRYLGSSRRDPCSRILKRQLLRKWLEANTSPKEATIYLGIDWTEEHRFDKAKAFWKPWYVEAPMLEPPYRDKLQMLDDLTNARIEIPRLYKMGFSHNNCGGFCIKAGQAHFAKLLKMLPERFRYHEQKEEGLQEYLNTDFTILRRRVGKKSTSFSLRELRERIEANKPIDLSEWGGCGCFTG